MTERPNPTRRAAARKRSSRAPLVAICVVLVLAGVGVFLWLVVFKSSSNQNTKKANDAVTAGLALQNQGDLTGAYAKYMQALKYEPKDAAALYDLAVIDNLQSNPGLAEQHYRQALAIKPNYEPALYNLALVEQRLGNNRYALSLYQKAVQADPNDANAHFNLALMLRATGDRKDGDAQMRIALRLNPSLKDPGVPKPSTSSPSASGSPSH
jgi:tetratricopeptide (TPR) repeat protein